MSAMNNLGRYTAYEIYKTLKSERSLFIKFVGPIHLSIVSPSSRIVSTHFTLRFSMEFMTSYLFESLLFAYRDFNPEFFFESQIHPYEKLIHLKIQNNFLSIEFIKTL